MEDQPPAYQEANDFNNGSTISIKIRKLDSTEYQVDINPNDTVFAIKRQLHELHLINPDLQRLIFQGRELTDDQIISQCHIENDSVLHLVIRVVPAGAQQGVNDQNPGHVGIPIHDNGIQDLNVFYVYRICRLIRSFSLINGFFFLLICVMAGSPLILIGSIGCAFGYIGAKKLNKCYLYLYMVWLTIEIIFRVYIMSAGSILVMFFTIMMVCLDLYVMRCSGLVARLISTLSPAQHQEILDLNANQSNLF